MGQQLAWLACAGAAGAGRPGVALLATATFVAAHLATRDHVRREGALLLAAGALGALGDAALVLGGAVSFPEAARIGPAPAPLWMIGLWMAFAALLRGALAWLGRDLRLAALAGALAGPVAYRGGQAFGALEVHGPGGLAATGALYAIAVPLLVALARAAPEPDPRP